ncbi:MAG: hypothetical protein D6739_02550 [Nitrospirae bacterium]|nr:MAG: hypothetical protein D6739_02550 [Nitrospirota bacterium]
MVTSLLRPPPRKSAAPAPWAAAVAVAALVAAVPAAAAWRVEVTPEVTARVEASDNVNFASTDRDALSDLSLWFEPALSWSLDRGDWRLEGRSREQVERFVEHDELDGSEPGHRVSLTWRPTPRLTLSLSEDFQRTRNLQDLFAAGAVVTERTRVTTNEAEASLTYQPTERWSLTASYTNYDSQSENPRFFDYLLHMVQASASRGLTERLGLTVGANLQDYDFNPTPGSRSRFFTRNYGLFAGIGYQGSERLDLTLQVGGRLTEQTVRFAVLDASRFPARLREEQDTTSNLASTLSLRATYRFERGEARLDLSQDLTASAGSQGTLERRTARLAARRWLSPDWRVDGAVVYSANKSDTTSNLVVGRDTRAWTLTGGLHYRITDHLEAGLTLRRLRQHDTNLGTRVRRSTAMVSITGRWPKLL